MSKKFFRFLICLMSLSLIGIILVQVYWFNTSFANNDEQFRFNAMQAISNVANQVQKQEMHRFINRYRVLQDSTGQLPKTSDFLEIGYYQRDSRTNETIIYSNSITAEDYNITSSFFDKKLDSTKIFNYTAKRSAEVYNQGNLERSKMTGLPRTPDYRMDKTGEMDILEAASYEIAFRDIAALTPISQRISPEKLQELLTIELAKNGIKTPFEFAVFSNNLATKVKSENFRSDAKDTYNVPVFSDNESNGRYQLHVSFPQKKRFLFSELLSITVLSIVFTLIIVVAYFSALNQLIKQRLISQIKTDFINNMTHEFKTPIATINLALDAIRNPKVIDNPESVKRYLQMIRDENKRMHAQVENVLRISKLEKRELEIVKESYDIHEIIEEGAEHVSLILEDRGGQFIKHFEAKRSTVLLNDVHFTNVMVNIFENAIKYSVEQPIIEVTTENVKDFIVIKVKDNGIGMSKNAQKRIFEKFYREHTGDVHNVKGHGLGLAYVKRIIDDHNGQIYVESEKGKGSTFVIKIPLIN